MQNLVSLQHSLRGYMHAAHGPCNDNRGLYIETVRVITRHQLVSSSRVLPFCLQKHHIITHILCVYMMVLKRSHYVV